MMMHSLKLIGMVLLAATAVLFCDTQAARAICSCEVVNEAWFIGMELTAKDCPPEGADDNTKYIYIDQAVRCTGGKVTLFSPWGDNQASPAWLQSYFSSQGLRVFRNKEGTHFVAVHPNFKGKINGLRMADFAGGRVYMEKAMDQQCVSLSEEVKDEDGDGVPFCQDCDDKNPEVGRGREDMDGDGVPQCYDCDDNDKTLKSGKGIDLDQDGYDQCRDCNDYDPKQNLRCETCPVGQPVDYFTGAMTHDIDLINLPGAPVELAFSLHYDSHKESEQALGAGWTHNHAAQLVIGADTVIFSDQSRRPPMFVTYDHGVTWYPGGATQGSLVKTAQGFVFTRPDAQVLTFDAAGRLLERKNPHGLSTAYAYDAAGRLDSVTDPSGRTLQIDYYPGGTPAQGLVMAVQDPAGHTFRFGYSDRRLAAISYPDADDHPANDPVAYLHYTDFAQEQLSNGGDPNNLTKLVDTRGNALSWSYDANDRAVLTTGPQGVNRLALTYASADTTVILNSKNEPSTYTYDDVGKTLAITGPGCTSCSRSTVSKYSPAGNLIEKVDGQGTITRYQDFDHNGNPGTVIEAAGTADEQVRQYNYHPRFNKITSERQKGAENIADRETLYTYDETTGDLLSIARKGYSNGVLQTLTTHYAYNHRGQPVRIDGPRTDVDDSTTMTYDPGSGFRLSVTQPLAGTTRFADYNALGYPGAMIDANGNTTQYTYDHRGRVIRTVGPQGGETLNAYDAQGNLVSTKLPSGTAITYAYDHADRLVAVTDSQGNQLRYFYDSAGNRTREETLDRNGALTRYLDYAYDANDRLWKVIKPEGTFAEYRYDNNNNTVLQTDPDGKSTHYSYDPFNRLVQVTDPADGITGYTYDINGNLSSVTDANGHTTAYQYDDFGRLLSESSPDSGKSLYTCDEAGNLVQKLDARGLITTFAYDALNRLAAVHYPDSTQDIFYTYDEGKTAKAGSPACGMPRAVPPIFLPKQANQPRRSR